MFRLTLLSIVLGVQPVLAQSSTPAVQSPDEALVAANASFRAEYAVTRAEMLHDCGPVIVVYEGDRVALLNKGVRTEMKFAPPTDALFKGVAHMPLGVFGALVRHGDEALTPARVEELRRHRQLLAAARAGFISAGFPSASLQRQYRIADESLAMLDAVIASGRADSKQLHAFTRRMGPLVLENIGEAARGQIDGLHARVSEFRRQLSEAEWRQLHVVVIGIHMAREGELATQYFLRLLGEPAEGGRVVYAESLFDEPKALESLGVHLIDARAGLAFFGSGRRMHRDVYADATQAYLDVLGIEP